MLLTINDPQVQQPEECLSNGRQHGLERPKAEVTEPLVDIDLLLFNVPRDDGTGSCTCGTWWIEAECGGVYQYVTRHCGLTRFVGPFEDKTTFCPGTENRILEAPVKVNDRCFAGKMDCTHPQNQNVVDESHEGDLGLLLLEDVGRKRFLTVEERWRFRRMR
jgi:hypothetical protein